MNPDWMFLYKIMHGKLAFTIIHITPLSLFFDRGGSIQMVPLKLCMKMADRKHGMPQGE